VGNPNFGAPIYLGLSLFTLVVILALTRWGSGFISNVAVLLGIIAGAVAATLLGLMHFESVGRAEWFALVLPFQFGTPVFDLGAAITMCLVMIVVMIESTGMFLALGEMVGKPVSQNDLVRGLRTDGLGTFIGGVFNTFPYTSFSQNVGLVGITGVRSRWVCVAGGFIMIALGLVPKMAALVEAVPPFVLGGAGLVMFGMVAATGVRILTNVDFKTNRMNMFIVAISVAVGMIPLVAPTFFRQMPHALHPLLESGILLSALMAVLLNVFFNGLGSAEAAREGAAGSAAAMDHA
jgi:NCS2 family nucleobase:cation symporter-2